MQTYIRPECRFKYEAGRAECVVCGRSFSAPKGKTRAYCSAQSDTKQPKIESTPFKAAQSSQWSGQWELVQGCPGSTDCSCNEPNEYNPTENQTYQTECSSPSNYICDYYQGCIQNPYGSWGVTLTECQSSCDRHFECTQSGCIQNTYFGDFQPWQFRDQPSCEIECIDRYYCDYDQGCLSSGKGTTGLTLSDCANCVVTQVNCDYFSGCRDAYGIGDPNSPPPECPPTCDRYFECGFSGCTQSFYFSEYGYDQTQCDAVCLETFYCDNAGGCQGIWSDFFYYPYSDRTSCEAVCVERVYCDFSNGCLPAGLGDSGPTDCSEISETCGERFYCDELSGCVSQGHGTLNPGQTYSCDESSCIKYFLCLEGQGCSARYYQAGGSMLDGGFATREECNDPSNCTLPGCTNPNSPNYNPGATCDDGSCQTCFNQGLCVIDDESPCKGLNCNEVGNGCCDYGCLPCDTGPENDCSPSFQGAFSATGCDGSTIEYPSCF